MNFGGRRYVAGPVPGTRTEPNKQDVEEIARVVKSASALADIVIVSLHCHEGGANRSVPADFIPIFAKAVIDAGADVFVGHGPHVLRGIEIYKGKPIFYSVGNFVFQNETVGFFPADAYERFDLDLKATPSDFLDARTNGGKKGHPSDPAYWENMFAVCEFAERKLKEIKIYPIDQGFGRPRPQRGRPMLADGEVANRVIERLIRLSARYGTKVLNRDGVGVIEL